MAEQADAGKPADTAVVAVAAVIGNAATAMVVRTGAGKPAASDKFAGGMAALGYIDQTPPCSLGSYSS